VRERLEDAGQVLGGDAAPWSFTETVAVSPLRFTRTSMCPCCGENFTALCSTLPIACARRFASAFTGIGASGISTSISRRCVSMDSRMAVTAAPTTCCKSTAAVSSAALRVMRTMSATSSRTFDRRATCRSIASAGRRIFSSVARDFSSHALLLMAWTGLRSWWERTVRNSPRSMPGRSLSFMCAHSRTLMMALPMPISAEPEMRPAQIDS
jgi:hypothetical protein